MKTYLLTQVIDSKNRNNTITIMTNKILNGTISLFYSLLMAGLVLNQKKCRCKYFCYGIIETSMWNKLD